MIKHIFGLFIGGLLLFLDDPAAHAQQRSDVTLKVGSYGGVTDQILKKYAADLYTARTGVKIEIIDGNADDHLAKLIAGKGREAPYDVVLLDDGIQVKAIDAGVLRKVSESDLPNLKYVYDDAKSKEGYGPARDLYSCGITYNAQKLKDAGIPVPTSWADLWSPQLAGRVAIPALNTTMGQCTLAAAERLAGGDESTPEKGIAKIAEIKAQSYPESSATITALLTSGDAWVIPWLNGRAWNLINSGQPFGYVLPKEGGYRGMTMVDVVAGSKHPAEALAFVNEIIGPAFQIGMVTEAAYGPINTLLVPILEAYPKMSQQFPASPKEFAALNSINWEVFNAKMPVATKLWDRQVLSK